MNPKTIRILTVLLAVALAFSFSSCKKKIEPVVSDPVVDTGADAGADTGADEVEEVPEPTFQRPEEPVVEDVPDPSVEEVNASGVLRTVYFALDRDELSPEARTTLQANARWLKENPAFKVVVEGHCDERGSLEYNLNLGERRAKTVREYLVGLGIAPGRIRIVTYGEERPADPGHNEAAWSKNRRAETKAESKS